MRAAQGLHQLAFIEEGNQQSIWGQHQPESASLEHVTGGEEREDCEGDWDNEKAESGWYEGATVDLAWCQTLNGGSLGGRNPSTPRKGMRPNDSPLSPRVRRRHGKWRT